MGLIHWHGFIRFSETVTIASIAFNFLIWLADLGPDGLNQVPLWLSFGPN